MTDRDSNLGSSIPDKAPSLSGIQPKGGDPMGEDQGAVPEVNPLVRLAVQFFVVPMGIVAFCVALVFLFRWLTWEKRDVQVYLQALQASSRTAAQKENEALKLLNYIQEAKQWQSIYDVSQELRFNRQKFLADHPDFAGKVAQAFKSTPSTDYRTRQYLVQVLGLVGGPEILSVLMEGLSDPNTDTVIHSMIALGKMQEATALPRILEVSRSSDPGVRQTAIFVLGNFSEPQGVARCVEALGDPDQLVRWNAAFSLGRTQVPEALPVLREFLDLDGVEKAARNYAMAKTSGIKTPASGSVSSIQPDRLEQYRATAVRLMGYYQDPTLKAELKLLSVSDKQMKVRQAAIMALAVKPGEKPASP